MLLEGIQGKKPCKIRSNAYNKGTTGMEAEKALNSLSSGNLNCHVFTISDAQINIIARQLKSKQH